MGPSRVENRFQAALPIGVTIPVKSAGEDRVPQAPVDLGEGVVDARLSGEGESVDGLAADTVKGRIGLDSVGVAGEDVVEKGGGLLEPIEVDRILLVPEDGRDALLVAPRDQLAEKRQSRIARVFVGGNPVLPAAVVPRPCRLDEKQVWGMGAEMLPPVLDSEVGVQVALGSERPPGHLIEDRRDSKLPE